MANPIYPPRSSPRTGPSSVASAAASSLRPYVTLGPLRDDVPASPCSQQSIRTVP
ncbi:hypothetical protein LX32DRAFT_639971 [Colletotrichum zoysiae]|uniref:Uncharacterized protein n=1 Tax=Colletotrichum zoysiae TaxID=1216348 RepID=A0AAD9HI70_9PEZI|nr:hypothetical protein LX32DRAFT_639971 [Colletotrichum zoysiae]